MECYWTIKKALEKLKKFAVEDFEKQMKKIRDGKRATEEQIKEVEHILKRQSERNLISGEYIRSQIPGASLTILDAAHISNVEQPHAFTDAVVGFLTQR